MRNGLLIGLGAGVVSALVLVAAAKGSLFGLFLFVFLTPLPIIIVGLGWGWVASLMAAAAAAGVMLVFSQPKAALLHLFAIGLPMVIFSYFLLLNRMTGATDNNGQPVVEWYPPGRVLGIAAIIAGVLAALSMLSIATDVPGLEAEVRKAADKFFGAAKEAAGGAGKAAPKGWVLKPGGKPPTAEDIDAFVKVMTRMFPAAMATFWMALTCLNLWLGGVVAQASNRLGRPWPDLSLMALPRETPLVFIGVIGLTLVLDGFAGLIASGFASAFFFAYLIIGLAIIHNITRRSGARPLILFAVYLALFVLNPFSGIIIAMLGIGEPILPIRRQAAPPPGPSGST